MSTYETDVEIIHVTTMQDLIEEGVFIDARNETYGDVTEQHFNFASAHMVTMTVKLHAMINKAVDNKKHGNDHLGIWHDICHMMRFGEDMPDGSKVWQAMVTGVGRKQWYTFKGTTQWANPEGDIALVIDVLTWEPKQ